MNFITHLFRILKYGTSYAIATGFFPKETAKKVLLLYSFVRIPDNIVDQVIPLSKGGLRGDQLQGKGSPPTPSFQEGRAIHYTQAKTKLLTLRDERTQAYTNNDRSDPTRGQYVALFQDNDIPFQYSLDFYKAMINDCTLHRYKTYEQLKGYMYGSASVVGLMMCHIIGFTDPTHKAKAKVYATELGNAMQLTNFLRDVREDYEELGRIYVPMLPPLTRAQGNKYSWGGDTGGINHSENDLPLPPLSKRGISHADIISFCHGGYTTASEEKKKARADTMKLYISKCRTMYTHSLDGLQYLNPEGRKAVRLAALLYSSILDKIESNHYDVFTTSCRTNLWDKCKVLLCNRK